MSAPIGRRQFVASAGGTLFCTLAGHRLTSDSHVNINQLAGGVPVPPRVAAYYEAQARAQTQAQIEPQFVSETRPKAAAGAAVHTYWIKAVKTKWDIVPTHRDGMMDRKVPGKTKFTALAYQPGPRASKSRWARRRSPGRCSRPRRRRNDRRQLPQQAGVPVTMHPHGIFYSHDMDGAYKGKFTEPGGFVENGRTFQYVWEARPGTEGAWLYHDHGPMDPLPVFKGLFGALIIRKPTDPAPDPEFFLCFHSYTPLGDEPGAAVLLHQRARLRRQHADAARQGGRRVSWHVYALDNYFHTFHLHGHRWSDEAGLIIDNQTLGPADVTSFSIVEDNPGRWFYHCHVFSHLHMGMNGWYVVSP